MWEMIEKMVKKEEGFLSKFSGPKFETSIELYNLVNILGHYNMPIDKLRYKQYIRSRFNVQIFSREEVEEKEIKLTPSIFLSSLQ